MSKPVTISYTFATQSGNVPASELDANYTALANAVNDPYTYANAATDTGSANAYVVTLSPAPATLSQFLPIQFIAANANTGVACTLNVNSLGAKSIVRRDGTTPLAGDIPAGSVTLVMYDGTNYQLLTVQAPTASSSALQEPVRQTVLAGAQTSGAASFLSAGTGLAVNLAATATPIVLSFAQGDTVTGQVNYRASISADAASYWSSLPASSTVLLSIDRNAGTGALSATSAVVPPQYGTSFQTAWQGLLHFENNVTDDWGNTYTNNNLTFSNTILKFGSYSAVFNGTNAYLSWTPFALMFAAPWTIEFWFRTSSTSTTQSLINIGNGSGWGIELKYNDGSADNKISVYLSSNGSSWNIASGGKGTGTIADTTTFHHIAVSWDGTTYRTFLDGAVQYSVASGTALYSSLTAAQLGRTIGSSNYLNGYVDEYRFSPCCRYAAAFTAPVAQFGMDGDWFDTVNYKMFTPSAAGPTWTPVQRLYVGECVTGASSVSSVNTYALRGTFDTTFTAGGASTQSTHNLGVPPGLLETWEFEYSAGTWAGGPKALTAASRTQATYATTSSAYCRFVARRGF